MHRIILLWFFLCCAPLVFAANTPVPVLLGQPRPAFALPDRNGTLQSIAQWNGHVIVLNFWATWCIPCRTEIPLLNALQNEYGLRGVQVVGIAVDNAAAVQQFEQRIVRMDYPLLIGDNTAIALVERYGNAAGTLPYTVFIRNDGKIEALASGALTADAARRTLGRMLDPTRD